MRRKNTFCIPVGFFGSHTSRVVTAHLIQICLLDCTAAAAKSYKVRKKNKIQNTKHKIQNTSRVVTAHLIQICLLDRTAAAKSYIDKKDKIQKKKQETGM